LLIINSSIKSSKINLNKKMIYKNMEKNRSLKILFSFLFLILLIQIVCAADVAYILVNDRNVDYNILDVFSDMGLTVEVIEDSKVLTYDLSQYSIIFIDDARVRKTKNLQIYNYPAVIMNKYYGEDWGLTDRDGISQLGSTNPLYVNMVDNGIQQVYTQGLEGLKGVAIPYYFLDDHNKANVTAIARTYTGEEDYDFGDVVATAQRGTHLINGKIAGDKICFFGIAKTEYWTDEARQLFIDCVDAVLIECHNDADCNDFEDHTYDYCVNPGTEESYCGHDWIECFDDYDCGIDGLIGDPYCVGDDAYQNNASFTCHDPGETSSYCSNNTWPSLLEICADTCYLGVCVTGIHDVGFDDNYDTYGHEIRIRNPSNAVVDDPVIIDDGNGLWDIQFRIRNNGEFEEDISINCSITGSSGTVDSWLRTRTGLNIGSTTTTGNMNDYNFSAYSNGFYTLECIVSIDGFIDTNSSDNSATRLLQVTNQTNITCIVDLDCGSPYNSSDYCVGNDVYRDLLNPICVNGSCGLTNTSQWIANCTSGCLDGFCIGCNNDSDCGTDGPIGDPFCIMDNSTQEYIYHVCSNPGTNSSYCGNTTANVTLEECAFGCVNGTCNGPPCVNDTDCGNESYSAPYCIADDSYRDHLTPVCVNNSCDVLNTTELYENCSDTCVNGTCINQTITCSNHSDCGTDGFIGDVYCVGLNRTQDYALFFCSNPGLPISYCSNLTFPIMLEECAYDCVNGTCDTPPVCVNDTDCGTPYNSTDYCIVNDVYRDLLNPICVNGSCGLTNTTTLVENCSDICFNGTCINSSLGHNIGFDDNYDGFGNRIRIRDPSDVVTDDPIIVNNGNGEWDIQFRTRNIGNFTENITIDCNISNSVVMDSWASARNNLSVGETTTIANNNNYNFSNYENGTYTITCVASIDGFVDIDPSDNIATRLIQVVNSSANVTCYNDSDCGTDGFIGPLFCIGENVTQEYLSFYCNEPGLTNSSCGNSTINITLDVCAYGCTSGVCDSPVCVNDTDCGTPYNSTDYCVGLNVTRDVITPICVNNSCETDNSTIVIEICSDTCLNGACTNQTNITCYDNSDCGIDGAIGSPYCIGDDSVQEYINYTCNNPGDVNSSCSNITSNITTICDDYCAAGICQDYVCEDNSDCGTDGFIGNLFCQNTDVYQYFLSFICNNPSTPSATCTNSTTAQLIEVCAIDCVNGTCTSEPVCGDGNLDAGEECDDGNTVSKDGCSAICEQEQWKSYKCNPHKESYECDPCYLGHCRTCYRTVYDTCWGWF